MTKKARERVCIKDFILNFIPIWVSIPFKIDVRTGLERTIALQLVNAIYRGGLIMYLLEFTHYGVNMKLNKKIFVALAAAASLLFAGCGDSTNITPAQAQAQGFQVYSGSGATLAAAQTNFVAAIDATNTNNAGAVPSQATGFRSVNWDAGIVPVDNNTFPSSFFNTLNGAFPVQRGLVVGAGGSTGNTGMRVSSQDFNDVNATYGAQFNAFSAANTFAPTTSNVIWVRFEVPGRLGVAAGVKGFGAVFSDVDTVGSTTMEFFNGNTGIGTFVVPVRSDANGHSFVGVNFTNSNKATSVKITLGNGTLGAATNDITDGAGNPDLVVLDDFFYAEPRVVGTP